MAANPITVGELTDVPAPNSAVNAQFHQEVANRITHRFATIAQMNAWAAANGSVAWNAEANAHYGRLSGAWYQLARQDALVAIRDNLQSQITSKPEGLVAYGPQTSNFNGSGVTPVNVPGCVVTWNAVPGRWHRITASIGALTADGRVYVSIVDGSGTVIRQVNWSGNGTTPVNLDVMHNGLVTTATFRIAVNAALAGISFSIPVGAQAAVLTAEDMGAN